MSNKLPAGRVKERLARIRQRGHGANGFLANLLGPTDYLTYVERMIRSEHLRPIQARAAFIAYLKKALADLPPTHNYKNRRRDVTAKIKAFKTGRAWRGTYPRLAQAVAEGLAARCNIKRKSRGRTRGTMRVSERIYVERAYSKLAAAAELEGYRGLDDELSTAGRGNRPSRGRYLLCRTALSLAESESVSLDQCRLTSAVRRFAASL